jgi:hypothetical protein
MKNIKVEASAYELKKSLEKYYRDAWGSWIDVNMTMYQANGTNTTNVTLATERVYHVVVRKLISQSSVSNIQVIKQTQATVTVEQPTMVQLSDQPVKGKYRITCPIPGNDMTLQPITTEDIDRDTHPRWIRESIYKNCSGFYDKIDVWRANGKYDYTANGIGLYLRFIGKNGPQTQMRIVSGVGTPLT